MRAPRLAAVGLLGVLALSGCGGAATPAASPSTGADQPAAAQPVEVTGTFAEPPADAATYDPELVPVGAKATVTSAESNGATTVTLTVSGLLPDREYGAHAHTKACGADGDAAGPHYQFMQDPVTPSVDPAFANAENEVWLDFGTDADGAATQSATVQWVFPGDRRAESVIIHEMQTATEAGTAGKAGARPACITVDF